MSADVQPLAAIEFRGRIVDVARFTTYFTPGDTEDCWPWQGPSNGSGYGGFNVRRAAGGWSTIRAHQAAVLISGREIPTDMEVDHVCRNRKCVNPAHLEVVTHAENVARAPWDEMYPAVHGRPSTYTHRGCRCDDCKAAWAAHQRKRRADRAASVAAERARREEEVLDRRTRRLTREAAAAQRDATTERRTARTVSHEVDQLAALVLPAAEIPETVGRGWAPPCVRLHLDKHQLALVLADRYTTSSESVRTTGGRFTISPFQGRRAS